MELKQYLQIVLRGWWLILPTIMISLTTALVISYIQTPIYESDATFVVSPNASFGSVYEILSGVDSLSRRDGIMATYAEIATSATILDAVYKEMQLSGEQIENLKVGSDLIPSTNIIMVIVQGPDRYLVRDCADLVGEKTIAYVEQLYEIYDMKPLDKAYTPSSPIKPSKMKNLLLAGVLGMGVGVGSAFLLHYLRSSGQKVASISIIDSDIGVYNRQYFMQRLGEELSRAKHHRHPLSVVLLNVERLDLALGERMSQMRSKALRRVAFFLKEYLRPEDLVAYFEGDTFALLFPDTSGPDAEKVMRKLHARIDWTVFELEEVGLKLNLTATSGVVAYDFNGAGRDEILVRAQETLQQARDIEYGSVRLFKPKIVGVEQERDGSNLYT